MKILDSNENLNLIGRCDDGSDVAFASEKEGEELALMGIEKSYLISNVYAVVALRLKKKDPLESLPFATAWTVLSTVLHKYVS